MTAPPERESEPASAGTPPPREERGSGGIPLRAHLIWFGANFPWVNVLAVRSAALRGGFDEVVLHHDSDLSRTRYFRALVDTPGVVLKSLDLPALFHACAPFEHELSQIYARLRTPAVRSDLVRFALLFSEGGVYLDIDTVTIRDFVGLCRDVGAFCAEERIVWPAHVRASRDPLVRFAARARSQLRSLLRDVPGGWIAFRKVESLYHLAANPAVLASAARSRFIAEAIAGMVELPPAEQPLPNVIGPHLLQKTLAAHRGSDVSVLPPEVFYPLGPEISAHWFRTGRPDDLARILSPETRSVHWYASIRNKQLVAQIDPEYVRANASQQAFSALALPFL